MYLPGQSHSIAKHGLCFRVQDPHHDGDHEEYRNVRPHVGVFVRVEEGLGHHHKTVQHAGQDAEIEQGNVATRVFSAGSTGRQRRHTAPPTCKGKDAGRRKAKPRGTVRHWKALRLGAPHEPRGIDEHHRYEADYQQPAQDAHQDGRSAKMLFLVRHEISLLVANVIWHSFYSTGSISPLRQVMSAASCFGIDTSTKRKRVIPNHSITTRLRFVLIFPFT